VSTEESTQDPREADAITVNTAPKRPEELSCDIHQANIKGEAWTILIGLLNGQPYEVIGGLSEYVEIPRRYTTGMIKKRVRKSVPSKYDLAIGQNDDGFVIKDVVKVFDNPNHSAFTRTLSLALRHGVPVQYLVEQLQKDKDADLFSFSKVIARCLKKYIADGTKASNGVLETCCDSPNVIYQEGCATCVNCGAAKCG
jgi:ribonucleoside-diphosphate reductase alpha chain